MVTKNAIPSTPLAHERFSLLNKNNASFDPRGPEKYTNMYTVQPLETGSSPYMNPLETGLFRLSQLLSFYF